MSTIQPVFDAYAENYDDVLNSSIAASGETKEYFAEGRMRWLGRRLRRWCEQPVSVLDFGCGTGSATPYFFEVLGASSVIGLDVSSASLRVAQETYGNLAARFMAVHRHVPEGSIDLAFTNGVFHHITPAERLAAVVHIVRSLRPGGLLAFWENNAWNPGTRYCMHINPFDRDAIPISPRQAVRLVKSAGLGVLETSFAFIFPRTLKPLRALEPWFCRAPLGAQFLVLARKAESVVSSGGGPLGVARRRRPRSLSTATS